MIMNDLRGIPAMINFQIRLAEICIGISVAYRQSKERCEDYLCSDGEPAFCVEITQEDLEKEEKYYKKRNGTVLSGRQWILEDSALYRKIAGNMIDYSRILIHGSALSIDGSGYLFIAPSGTGKSTHSALWRKVFGERVVMVNDDKPLVRVENGEIVIYGTPWNGKHGLGSNICVPLKGICRVYRTEENRIEKVDKDEAMARLLEQTYRSEEPYRVAKTLGMLKEMIDHVPVYALYCNMEEDAALTAYEGMTKGKQYEVEE